MDQVFSKETKTLKKILENWKKYWKSQGILSVRKSGNPDDIRSTLYAIFPLGIKSERSLPTPNEHKYQGASFTCWLY